MFKVYNKTHYKTTTITMQIPKSYNYFLAVNEVNRKTCPENNIKQRGDIIAGQVKGGERAAPGQP